MPPRWSRTAASSRPRRKSASPARSTTRRFPSNAIDYCLAEAGASLGDIDHVVFYDKPFLKFERLLETYLAFAPRGFRSFRMAMPLWLREKLFQKNLLRQRTARSSTPNFDWQSCCSPSITSAMPRRRSFRRRSRTPRCSPWTASANGRRRRRRSATGNDLEILKEIHFPHSLGLLYSAFTYYTGFKVNSGEYKLMGLAPYGEPKYAELILDNLIDLKPDGSFRLDMSTISIIAPG